MTDPNKTSASEARRIAVVTGAANGIGAAIAVRLARAGFDIAIADLVAADETERAVAACGQRAWSERCDLSDPDDVARFAALVLDREGRCEVLVNNAAHQVLRALDELDIARWRKVHAVNLDAAFLLCQALTPGMVERGSGRVVNIISNTIWDPPPVGLLAYVASKSGLLGLTRALAGELAGTGVTVNAVAPGLTATGKALADLPPEMFDAVVQRQAVRRPLVADDQAAAVAFLVSDDAAAISGQALRVDGGFVRL